MLNSYNSPKYNEVKPTLKEVFKTSLIISAILIGLTYMVVELLTKY